VQSSWAHERRFRLKSLIPLFSAHIQGAQPAPGTTGWSNIQSCVAAKALRLSAGEHTCPPVQSTVTQGTELSTVQP
jgi:hypothetical protein